MFKKFDWLYMADDGTVTGETNAGEPQTEPVATPQGDDFDAWLEKQPEEVKKKFAEKYGNLASALEKERGLSAEAKKTQKRLKELEEAEAKRKADAMTAEEKILKELETERASRLKAEETLNTERLQNAVRAEASKYQFDGAKFISPDDALLAIRQYGEIAFEDGKPVGVVEALQKMAKDKKHWLEKPATTSSPSPVKGKPVKGIEPVADVLPRVRL